MQNSDCVWISHRGYCGGGQRRVIENSLQSFQAAVSLGFDELETDLRTTKDGFIVLSHDESLVRNFGLEVSIAQVRLADLKRILSNHGHEILTLPVFMKRFFDKNWIFDVKPHTAKQTIDALVRWARTTHGSGGWLLAKARFLFWHPGDQAYFLSYFPKARCLASEKECWRSGLLALWGVAGVFGKMESGKTYSLPPKFFGLSLYTKAIVRQYHQSGARLLAYLPQSGDARKAMALGFDEILMDGKPER